VLAVGAVFLVAGCGGGGGSDESSEAKPASPTETTLSTAELIEQGDAICAEVNSAIGSIEEGAGGSVAAEKVAELYIGMVGSLKELSPSEDAVAYGEFAAVAGEFETAENEVRLAARTEQPAALEAAEAKAAPALPAFQSAASEYGFNECSEDPSAPVTSTSPGVEGEAEGGVEAEESPEAVEPEAAEPEAAPEEAPETGGAGGTAEGGGAVGAPEGGGETGGGGSGGIGPG
jgi:hypothetical protein